MARPRYAHLFSPTPWRWVAALPEIGRRVLFAGISSPERLVRRRQMFTNILAGVAAFNALFHLAANAAYELEGLLPVHIYNAVMMVFCLVNHRLHRLGDTVAAVVLLTGITIGHSFVLWSFGTASDLHVYFTLAGFSLFLIGIENFRLFLALMCMTFAALLAAIFAIPEYGAVLVADQNLRQNLAVEAMVSAFFMNGLLTVVALSALHRAEERSEALISAMLPERIAERLKVSRDRRIADRVDNCSVLFLDMVGFTGAANEQEPEVVVAFLDRLFSRFDEACQRHGAEKIKTLGDGYLAAGGLDGEAQKGARAIGLLAIDLARIIDETPAFGQTTFGMRAGIHSGPVTAGVIGDIRISYDIWGDTVNTASRMESHASPGRIHVSEDFKKLADEWFTFEPRGAIEVKGLGQRVTYFLTGVRAQS
ncbi:MAG: adenylate/guanylate cyclase domain-containing protein [Rhizobiales bacterium]|nr:adenylate/guanylate cyclase domain-containing protein [Hyphomicrobiales bacterium]